MTTSANPLLENCCNPCNSCPDDGPIIDSVIIDPSDCSSNCCWNSCSDNRWINIQSTNDCLIVDTSECGVVKLTAECPRPTYVKAWNNVTVRDVTPPDDCYIDWWDCWVKWGREINATDEKVKACAWDTTPGYLNQKLEEGPWINIDPIWCDWWNARIRISLDESFIPDPPDIPDIIIDDFSSLIDATADWHRITITDQMANTFDNAVCIWFINQNNNQFEQVPISNTAWSYWNLEPREVTWDIYTGNKAMATTKWIKILKSWYYRVFGQLTVENNIWGTTAYVNLWRWLIKITNPWGVRPILENYYLTTAKHWAYTRHALFRWGKWIRIDDNWEITFLWGYFSWSGTAPEWWGRVEISGSITVPAGSWSQTKVDFDWPWMTFNMETFLDLYEWDILQIWYRGQSDMPEAAWFIRDEQSQSFRPGGPAKTESFRFVWVWDQSTEYHALFWWSVLGVCMITPTLFQKWESNRLYWYI